MTKPTHNEVFMYVDKIKAAMKKEQDAWQEKAEGLRAIRDWFNENKKQISAMLGKEANRYGWTVFVRNNVPELSEYGRNWFSEQIAGLEVWERSRRWRAPTPEGNHLCKRLSRVDETKQEDVWVEANNIARAHGHSHAYSSDVEEAAARFRPKPTREEERSDKSPHDWAIEFDRLLPSFDDDEFMGMVEHMQSIKTEIDPSSLHSWKEYASKLRAIADTLDGLASGVGVVDIRRVK